MNITINPGAATDDASQIDSIISKMQDSMQTLDTAFKRRWNFEKISNIFNDKEDEQYKRIIPEFKNDEGEEIKWGVFQETINNIIKS